jgi:hypothetical protein
MRGQLRHSPAKSFPVLLHPATRELCARPLFLSVLHLLLEALEPQLADFSVSVRAGARVTKPRGTLRCSGDHFRAACHAAWAITLRPFRCYPCRPRHRVGHRVASHGVAYHVLTL